MDEKNRMSIRHVKYAKYAPGKSNRIAGSTKAAPELNFRCLFVEFYYNLCKENVLIYHLNSYIDVRSEITTTKC